MQNKHSTKPAQSETSAQPKESTPISPFFTTDNTTTRGGIWRSHLRSRLSRGLKVLAKCTAIAVVFIVAGWIVVKAYDFASARLDILPGLLPQSINEGHAATPAYLNGIQPVKSPQGFTHPGVFVSLPQLAYTRAKVAAKEKPYITIYNQLAKSEYVKPRAIQTFEKFASASVYNNKATKDDASAYVGKKCSPRDTSGCMTYCGPYQNPNVGCTELRDDARAVYSMALMYYYSGDKKYANRAIKILNAYAKHFRGNAGATAHLMSSWHIEMMVRGAEIIRYTYVPTGGDAQFNVTEFSNMLRRQRVGGMLANIDRGESPGNWKLSGANGLMSIAVFLDDRALYNKALAMWRERVKSYIYIHEDGPLPYKPVNDKGLHQDKASLSCYWLHNRAVSCQTTPKTDPKAIFQDGQAQEACRDFGHTQLGFATLIATAETAYHQGIDLYKSNQKRLRKGITYLVQVELNYAKQGWPRNFCNGLVTGKLGGKTANWNSEVAYNALTVRNGVTLGRIAIPGYSDSYPNNDVLAAFIAARKQGESNVVENISAWETLTHHHVGKGLK